MLSTRKIVAFVGTQDPKRAKRFFGSTLGLRLVSEDSFAIVFDAERPRGLPLNCGTPIGKIMSVEHDAEEIAGKEAVLRRLDADDTNDQAI